MRELTQYQNKKVLVLGLAKSGVNAARLLNRLGALVTVNDKQAFDANKDAQALLADGIKVITGSHPVALLDEHFELMVKNPGIPYRNPMVQRALALHIPIITEPELAYEVAEADWIGVTGTNGKTTTTTLIAMMLNEAGHKAFAAGNIGVPLSQVAQEAEANSTIVAELSSFQLSGITTLHPHIAVITNLYEAHLDWHGSRKAYVDAKRRITQNQTAQDVLVVNWDQPELRALAATSQAQIVPFSRQGAAQARARVEGDWLVFDQERIIEVAKLKLPGAHNIENALAALAAAKLAGAKTAAIAHVLATFGGVAHRLQYVDTIKDRRFYNDSKATNVEAATVAITAFAQPVVLLAGGLDRHVELSDLVPVLKKHVRFLVTFGQTAPLLNAVAKKAGIPYQEVKDVEAAVPVAWTKSQVGDVILLSPAAASWDQYPNFEVRGAAFIKAVESLAQKEDL